MNIVLSRKGTDSEAGGMPSPILPCGCLCSIPIPYSVGVPYTTIRFGNLTLDKICSDLKTGWEGPAHLDPDLRYESLRDRPCGWRPAFGQSGAAASHLINQGIRPGDLFVFFGWFRKTIIRGGQLAFDASDPHGKHIVYGWLQVSAIASSKADCDSDGFLTKHPHYAFFDRKGERFDARKMIPNLIYVGAESGLGSGMFTRESDCWILTKEGESRSEWLLPEAFKSIAESHGLTYHPKPKGDKLRFRIERDGIRLTSVSRGQEFVFDADSHSAARTFVESLIKNYRAKRTEGAGHNRCKHADDVGRYLTYPGR